MCVTLLLILWRETKKRFEELHVLSFCPFPLKTLPHLGLKIVLELSREQHILKFILHLNDAYVGFRQWWKFIYCI